MMVQSFIVTYAADVLGTAACGATLLTFAQKSMWPMRISAIAANLFFIGYGALGLLYPVLFLHLVLLPLNVARLVQLAQRASEPGLREGLQVQPIIMPRVVQADKLCGMPSITHSRGPGRERLQA